MRIGQRKTGGGMIKVRILPGNGVMAVGAGGNRKYRRRCRVLRVSGLLPSRQVTTRMAAIGGCNSQIVVAGYVAAFAGNVCVPIG